MTIASNQTPTRLTHYDLYERDFCLWVERALVLMREGNFKDLDLENLLEEIADMSNSQKQALESNLKIILMHLLKYKYQANKRTNSWRYTIVEHRQRIRRAFKNSPSGLSIFYLWVKTLETDTCLSRCELPIYRLLGMIALSVPSRCFLF